MTAMVKQILSIFRWKDISECDADSIPDIYSAIQDKNLLSALYTMKSWKSVFVPIEISSSTVILRRVIAVMGGKNLSDEKNLFYLR